MYTVQQRDLSRQKLYEFLSPDEGQFTLQCGIRKLAMTDSTSIEESGSDISIALNYEVMENMLRSTIMSFVISMSYAILLLQLR